MGLGLRAVGSALYQVSTHLLVTVVTNATAFALSLPLALGIFAISFGTQSYSLLPLGLALCIGILPNPLLAGVQHVARELAHGDDVSFGDAWVGLRRYGRFALKSWLFSVGITAILLLNVGFYLREALHPGSTAHALWTILSIVWSSLLLMWLTVHLYVFPLLMEQRAHSVRVLYRNAFAMSVFRPGVTATAVPIWLALLLLFTTTGLASVIGFAICAAVQQNCVAKLLPQLPVGAYAANMNGPPAP